MEIDYDKTKYLDFDVLRNCALFDDVDDKDLSSMLSCLEVKIKKYKKGEAIFSEGDPANIFGIIISGTAQIVRIDYFGNRSIVANVENSQLFGETFACAGLKSFPVDVIAIEDTEVVLIDANHVINTCNNACEFHQKLIYNLLKIVAKKNLLFNQKIEITSKRSTREKLMTYLLLQAKASGSNSFVIPYDRQELADYLEVERSGLSAQISKLRNEGVLNCNKNEFELLIV